ncbi:MAG TPA: virulence factor [Anaerolineales bacterium]|jgi:hypothetical protein|nr:virulence factor [Anaerolineales bacterium]
MPILYQIVYWRDIPAQVRVRSGSQRAARSLDPRFQEAIDEAAMQARTTSSDDYLEDWRTTEWQEQGGDSDLENFAASLVEKIESEHPEARLEALKKNKGYEPV